MKKLLLHACCAPCACYPLTLLKDYNVTLFYYNPNITIEEEYVKRLEELRKYLSVVNVPLLEGKYNTSDWFSVVENYKHLGEKSFRCQVCFMMRLGETFKVAKENNFDAVSTVLSISPHKDEKVINMVGETLSDKFKIDFLPYNFKQDGGFLKSVEISKKYNFYRQNYCGCIYSKNEAEERRRQKRERKA